MAKGAYFLPSAQVTGGAGQAQDNAGGVSLVGHAYCDAMSHERTVWHAVLRTAAVLIYFVGPVTSRTAARHLIASACTTCRNALV
jgi:hypothetical protein